MTVLKSIEHWERLKIGVPGEEPNASQCPLCQLYFHSGCVDPVTDEPCPIFNHTNERTCEATPYEDAYDAIKEFDRNPTPETLAAKEKACDDMINFLIILL